MRRARRLVYGRTPIDDHYEDVLIPERAEYYVGGDMDVEVACAQCGESVRYGDTYTSLEIRTRGLAWGYAVCLSRCRKEVARLLEADGRTAGA